jgi:hypothetical protein
MVIKFRRIEPATDPDDLADPAADPVDTEPLLPMPHEPPPIADDQPLLPLETSDDELADELPSDGSKMPATIV